VMTLAVYFRIIGYDTYALFYLYTRNILDEDQDHVITPAHATRIITPIHSRTSGAGMHEARRGEYRQCVCVYIYMLMYIRGLQQDT